MRAPVAHDDVTGKARRQRSTYSTRCGKNTYPSGKIARAVAAEARKATGEEIRPYHCYSCHGHHIGHPPALFDPNRTRDEVAA